MRLPRIFRTNSAGQNFSTRNGELLLQKQISFSQGRSNPIRVYTLGELQEATQSIDPRRRLGFGSSVCFRGILDDREVLVEDWGRTWDGRFEDRFVEAQITQIVIFSSIRHRNVLRLRGCCLETRVPALVFEFVPRRDLWYNLERWRFERPPWSTRLQIAIDVADALNYLHSYPSGPIVHRNVQPESVFLDEDYTAKLCNFSYSVPIPLGKTEIKLDTVSGVYHYVDPVYFATGILTEKTDVYAFGVILMELLTGERLPRHSRHEDTDVLLRVMAKRGDLEKPPADLVEPTTLGEATREQQLALEEACLAILIADAGAPGDAEGNIEQFRAFAKLAMKCVRLRMQERPTMREVVEELKRIRTMVLL